ncbi:Chloroquine-resistance transporter-like [Arabidopsis suecica]|uniref:Chloroquine-resistance transporter-like n=1 Tax=Arabidopsis suecica TaxID=45249 RepID=A0A8T1Z9M3_ARASU|nr:Chloroquine-resistance transporter-like [Arabidopsis suecica]
MATTSSGRLIAGLTASIGSIESRYANPAQSVSLICRNQTNGAPPIVLRSSRKSRLWLIEAIPPAKSWDGSNDGEEEIKKSDARNYAIGGIGGREVAGKNDRTMEIVIAAATTAALGVGNRVLYKLALIPLKQYPFFLAQLSTFGYVAVYFSILYFRFRAGIVTKEMLSVPKLPFLIVGVLESLALAAGMAAASNLSGPSTTVLSQTFLIWQILFSIIFLGRRYRINQILGCTLVAVGVIVSVASGSGAAHSFKDTGILWSLLMVLSFLLQGADTVMKEVIFLDSKKRLKGASLDLFVVNSYGSIFQVICIALLLPFLSKLWGIPFNQLPSYIRDGGACFLNIGSRITGCEGAPLLPVMFVMMNMAYNISLLRLIKISSAVVSSLASTVSVPIAVYCFTLPLPYLGVASTLPRGFVAGTVILVLGMLLYAWTPSTNTSDSIIPSPPST